MKKIYINIGDHSFLFIINSFKLENVIKQNFRTIFDNMKQPHMSIIIEQGYGAPFVDFEVVVTKQANKTYFRRADYLIEVDSDYKNARIMVYDEFALKHALMNLYSSYIVYHNWGLLIHSSCVIDNGKAHIFSGHSGAGKSTAAKLSQPRELLSDEATIVKISSNKVEIYHSPFSSELEMTNMLDQTCQLKSIQLLYQATEHKREKVSKSDAFLLLMDKVFYWSKDPEETRKILQLLKDLVDRVPAYKLYFQKNNRFWELIS